MKTRNSNYISRKTAHLSPFLYRKALFSLTKGRFSAKHCRTLTKHILKLDKHCRTLTKHIPNLNKHCRTLTKHIPNLTKLCPTLTKHIQKLNKYCLILTKHIRSNNRHIPSSIKIIRTSFQLTKVSTLTKKFSSCNNLVLF